MRCTHKDTNLWCKVVWCPTECCSLLLAEDIFNAHTEVCQFNMPVLVHQYVIWLQVSVKHIKQVNLTELASCLNYAQKLVY